MSVHSAIDKLWRAMQKHNYTNKNRQQLYYLQHKWISNILCESRLKDTESICIKLKMDRTS